MWYYYVHSSSFINKEKRGWAADLQWYSCTTQTDRQNEESEAAAAAAIIKIRHKVKTKKIGGDVEYINKTDDDDECSDISHHNIFDNKLRYTQRLFMLFAPVLIREQLTYN